MKNKPFKSDRYGSRSREVGRSSKPYSVYASAAFCLIATALFTLADFTQQYQNFEYVLSAQSTVILVTTAFVTASLLDIPLAIAATMLKAYKQGIEDRGRTMTVLWGSVICFVCTYAAYVPMKLKSVGELFQEGLTEEATRPSLIFFALLPMFTSIGSFIINYFGSDPLAKMILMKKKALIRSESRLNNIRKALSEANEAKDHILFLLESEEYAFKTACEQSDACAAALKQQALLATAAVIGSANVSSAAKESGEKVNNEFSKSYAAPDNVLDEYAKNHVK